MKQLKVEQERCIGCGACVAIAPENFDFDEEGKSHVISNENIEAEQVTNAMESCPTAAILISEENAIQEECHCNHEEENCECEHQGCCCNECDTCCEEDDIEKAA